jgi:hypothetical protein
MVNYTHGDLVEVVVLVIQIFTGEELHDVKMSCFLTDQKIVSSSLLLVPMDQLLPPVTETRCLGQDLVKP